MLRITTLAATVAVALTGTATAQTPAWKPDKVIKAVVPFGAGSATDGIARIVLDEVGKQLGQSIVVENRVGASGTIGANSVAKADPDAVAMARSAAILFSFILIAPLGCLISFNKL